MLKNLRQALESNIISLLKLLPGIITKSQYLKLNSPIKISIALFLNSVLASERMY